MLKSVGYLLDSFPLPSETFIADEIYSLYKFRVQPFVIYCNEGDRKVVHSSAKHLIESGKVYHLENPPLWKSIYSFLIMMVISPLRSMRVLMRVIASKERWRYLKTLPMALICLNNRVEFLHAHFAAENYIFAKVISDWTGIPYGVTTHGYDIRRDIIPRNVATELLNEASVVVTIAEFNKMWMQNRYGIPGERIRIVHCGVDTRKFGYNSKSRYEPGVPLRILNVGRLVQEKAHEVLFEALQIVGARGVPFVLEIVGSGPRLEELQKIAADLELEKKVIFHGAQSAEFVKDRFDWADLFVLSSRVEGLPIVCMESMATGTPIIATRISGIPEMIRDRDNGLLVPPDDPLALADAIEYAYRNPDQLIEMAKKGRITIESEFDRDKCTAQLIDLWENAIVRNY